MNKAMKILGINFVPWYWFDLFGLNQQVVKPKTGLRSVLYPNPNFSL